MSNHRKGPKPTSAKPTTKPNQKPKPRKQAHSAKDKGLHPQNRHAKGYDFKALTTALPKLSHFVKPNPFGNLSIDFADPDAVKCLNTAILKCDYGIQDWDIPKGFLCPPVPGRVDYLHYLADLLKVSQPDADGTKASKIRGLDIGVGANGIYCLLGVKGFGWQFAASDIDPKSIDNVANIATANQLSSEQLSLRLQTNPNQIFKGVVVKDEWFDFTMCNPPFHQSLAEATAGSARKVANLTANRQAKYGKTPQTETNKQAPLNFGGQKAELWCEGGELQFLTNMISESVAYAGQVKWFTSLVSKSENIKPCKQRLEACKVAQVKVIEMKQGSKITRMLAWSFMSVSAMKQWQNLHSNR
ncbi:23S rRNA (adenine(1618)-N(6))-methyltransferase RlmF [Shewanella maritima]|uniref:23S rRNA (adenine(1618)-N(6))-methyltransferase RlmF n=1 Tax=Shewanella maritima TaxID=2520507 RepID=UPI003735592E